MREDVENGDRATLEGKLHGMEMLIGFLLESLDDKQFGAIEDLLLNKTRWSGFENVFDAIKDPEADQFIRRVLSNRQALRSALKSLTSTQE